MGRIFGHNLIFSWLGTMALALWAGPAAAQLQVQSAPFGVAEHAGTLSADAPMNEEVIFFTPRQATLGHGGGFGGGDGRRVNLGDEDVSAGREAVDFRARLDRRLGALDVAFSGRVGNARADGDPALWATGVDLDLPGLTLSGSFAEQQNRRAEDLMAYEASIQYHAGPWGFALSYLNGKPAEDEAVAVERDERLEQYLLALNYRVSAGIRIGAYGGYVSLDSEIADSSDIAEDEDIRGFVLGTGVRLAF